MRKLNRLFQWTLVVLTALPLSGCLFSREIGQTRRQIEQAYPDLQLRKQFVLNLGPLSLSMLGWVTKLAPEEEGDMAARYLSDISRVKVGVFRIENPVELDQFSVGKLGFEKNWSVAVKVRDDEQRVWVLYREGGKTVKDLYVVVLNEEDLVVARVHGRLQRLVSRIIDDHAEFGFMKSRGTEDLAVQEDSTEMADTARALDNNRDQNDSFEQ